MSPTLPRITVCCPAEMVECLPLTTGAEQPNHREPPDLSCITLAQAAPSCHESLCSERSRPCDCVYVSSSSKLDAIWSNLAFSWLDSSKNVLLSLEQLSCIHDISKLKDWPIQFICQKPIVVLIAIGLVCCVVLPIFCPLKKKNLYYCVLLVLGHSSLVCSSIYLHFFPKWLRGKCLYCVGHNNGFCLCFVVLFVVNICKSMNVFCFLNC